MSRGKRTIIIVIILLLMLASVGLTAAMIIPSADELLTQSLETLGNVTDGHAVVEATVDLPDNSFNGTIEVWGKINVGPEGEPAMRVEVLDASEADLVGVTAVSDGSQFWLYDPNRNMVIVGQAEEMVPLFAEKIAEHKDNWNGEGMFSPEGLEKPETPSETVAQFLEYFTAERNGQEPIAGTDAYVLRLIPIPEKMPDEFRLVGGYLNLWLSTNEQLPLALEFAESAAGYGKFEAKLAEINTNFDESIFTFNIPDGTEVVEAAEKLAEFEAWQETAESVNFEPLSPGELPEAAVAQESQFLGGTFVQRYDLPEGKSFVVAQGASIPLDPPAEATSKESTIVRGVEGTLFSNDDGTRSLLVWIESDIYYLVGGDLTPDQAVVIAESLQ